MKRPYLRVTPGEAFVIPGEIPDIVASLHKLKPGTSDTFLLRLNPLTDHRPLRFEFIVLSQGEEQPLEFYYGADEHLDALEHRLRSIYPPSYDIDHVKIDVPKRLLRPVEYSRDEFAERVEAGQLYSVPASHGGGGPTPVSDGSGLAVAEDATDATNEPPAVDALPDQTTTEVDLDEGDSLTALDGPTETDDGHILARPPLSEVEPYGVEWWGSAERRKDWMTTLTGFTEVLGQDIELEGDRSGQIRLPLVSLLRQLADVNHPLAFQVVFQRRSDWSRSARRRSGELLDGTDTLLQKILGFESSGQKRTTTTSRISSRSTRHPIPRGYRSPNGGRQSRPSGIDEATRFDLVRANTPKRTFTVNLRLLALVVDKDTPETLEAELNRLCSAFDLIDGEYYEMDGRRLRAQGYLPGSGERHARKILNRFTERSITTRRPRVAVTNRSETRPDLVLNGNELANFVIIPPISEIPAPDVLEEAVTRTASDKPASEESVSAEEAIHPELIADDSQAVPLRDGSFSDIPESVIHRDDEVNQLISVLDPLSRGEVADTVLITGPTGSGKTCTVKFAVDKFAQKSPMLDAVYVNCWENNSRFQTLYRMLDELDDATDIHRQSTATDVILDRIREYDVHHCVLVLDEVDQLDDEGLLYDLLNLHRFSLILIVNREEDLFDGLDDRLASRLGGCEHIHLDQYSVDQLTDILTEYVENEAVSGTFERPELERIADAVNGDARVALTTLRIAARHVDEEAEEPTSADIVERALPKARAELRERHVELLVPHQQAILRVIEEHERIAPRDLFDEYRNHVEQPKSNRTVRKYLKKLERYGLVVAEGSTRDRVYRIPERRHSIEGQ